MVSLSKGQSISLDKTAGSTLTRVIMGLGWDARQAKGFFGRMLGGDKQIDLDASCVCFDQGGQLVDQIWFRQLQSRDGSIVHTGDNRTGEGEGDDEQIIVELDKVPGEIKTLIFVVNSFTGESFSEIERAFCRLVDAKTNKEIARYDLSNTGSHTAQVMAKVYRESDGWHMQAIGEIASGRTFQDLLPAMRGHV